MEVTILDQVTGNRVLREDWTSPEEKWFGQLTSDKLWLTHRGEKRPSLEGGQLGLYVGTVEHRWIIVTGGLSRVTVRRQPPSAPEDKRYPLHHLPDDVAPQERIATYTKLLNMFPEESASTLEFLVELAKAYEQEGDTLFVQVVRGYIEDRFLRSPQLSADARLALEKIDKIPNKAKAIGE